MFDNMHKASPEFEAALAALSISVCLGCGNEGTDRFTCDRCGNEFCNDCGPVRDDDAPIDLCENCLETGSDTCE
jgi:hypothetical protein